jgi:thiamine-phosphate pyrophosphorylase
MAELYLIAPADAEVPAFAEALKGVLAEASVAALLLPAGGRPERGYQNFVKDIAPIAQEAGCAVLIEGEPGLVRRLSVDGLHVAGPLAEVKAAVAALKPDFIVGTGAVETRHEAMTRGELGLDYIMFGPISGAIGAQMREMAAWWAETMEIPGVLSDPQALADTADAGGCEFLALSDSVWSSPDPAALVASIARHLEQAG